MCISNLTFDMKDIMATQLQGDSMGEADCQSSPGCLYGRRCSGLASYYLSSIEIPFEGAIVSCHPSEFVYALCCVGITR